MNNDTTGLERDRNRVSDEINALERSQSSLKDRRIELDKSLKTAPSGDRDTIKISLEQLSEEARENVHLLREKNKQL